MANVLAGHVLTEIQLTEMHDHVSLGAAVGEFTFPRKQTTAADVAIADKVLSGDYAYTAGPFSAVTGQPIYPGWAPAYAREIKVLHIMPQYSHLNYSGVAGRAGRLRRVAGRDLRGNRPCCQSRLSFRAAVRHKSC